MLQNRNGRIRVRRINFSQISNTALKDKNLSLKGKGLYAVIQSLNTIPGIDLRIWKIRSMCKEGDKAFDGAWKELKKTGYLKQYRIPCGKNGAFIYEYDLLFEPDLSTPATINLSKNGQEADSKKETLNPCNSDHTPQKGGGGEKQGNNHTPPFGPYAKRTRVLNRGGNSNTLFSNTQFSNTPSVSQSTANTVKTDGLTDGVREKLESQIDIDWIAETHPDDLPAAKVLLDCMTEMLTAPSTKIQGIAQSRETLRHRLEHVDEEDVVGFLAHMRDRGVIPKNIRNIGAYWKSAFVNYIGEQALAVAGL